jgi:hypothetical protein
MKEYKYIIINNNLIKLERYYYESDEMFYFRIKFILDNYKKNNKFNDLDNLIGLSKIEQEKKFNKCFY